MNDKEDARMDKRICPKCGCPIYGHPAISRTDNKTEICSECGTLEAIETYLSYMSGERFVTKRSYEEDMEVSHE